MKTKVKLLHIFSAPQSVFFFLDGQLDYIADNGFDIHIIMPDDGFYSKKLLERERRVTFHFVQLKREIAPLTDFKTLFSLLSIIKKNKPDILHLHTPKASFLGAVAARLCFQKNIIYQMHGLVSGATKKKGLIYYLEKYTCSLVDHVFAVSKSLSTYAVENGYCDRKKISVTGNGTINGIDWNYKFNPERLDGQDKYINAEALSGKFTIGYVGRLTEEKGINDFLYAVRGLKTKQIPVLGIILGKNEMGERFQDSLKEYGFDNSDLLIFDEVDDPEMIMRHFKVLVFPTWREGFGLVAAEANSLEIPVVSYDIVGVKDAVENGVTAKLAPYLDRDSLEKMIREYYNNEDERRQHGLAGRQRVKKLFTRKELWEDLLNKYNSLL